MQQVTYIGSALLIKKGQEANWPVKKELQHRVVIGVSDVHSIKTLFSVAFLLGFQAGGGKGHLR